MTTPPALLIADHGAHDGVGAASPRGAATTPEPRRAGPSTHTGLVAPSPPPPPGADGTEPSEHGARRFATARAACSHFSYTCGSPSGLRPAPGQPHHHHGHGGREGHGKQHEHAHARTHEHKYAYEHGHGHGFGRAHGGPDHGNGHLGDHAHAH
ncbi:hypothetical protein [Streptomyces sp. NPDC047315]|uniref:hypothetical protein n=1 Tax=Streptomyces sp. NPDC047315 TaxID=3155142 RepID=UPI0033C9F100